MQNWKYFYSTSWKHSSGRFYKPCSGKSFSCYDKITHSNLMNLQYRDKNTSTLFLSWSDLFFTEEESLGQIVRFWQMVQVCAKAVLVQRLNTRWAEVRDKSGTSSQLLASVRGHEHQRKDVVRRLVSFFSWLPLFLIPWAVSTDKNPQKELLCGPETNVYELQIPSSKSRR